MLRADITSLMKVHKRRNYAQDTYNHNVVYNSILICEMPELQRSECSAA